MKKLVKWSKSLILFLIINVGLLSVSHSQTKLPNTLNRVQIVQVDGFDLIQMPKKSFIYYHMKHKAYDTLVLFIEKQNVDFELFKANMDKFKKTKREEVSLLNDKVESKDRTIEQLDSNFDSLDEVNKKVLADLKRERKWKRILLPVIAVASGYIVVDILQK